MGDATQVQPQTTFPNHHRPYYSYMVQTIETRGSYCCWLVTAATRDDMIYFFKGFIKYSKTSNVGITNLRPIHLAWWTFDAPERQNIWNLVQRIYRTTFSPHVEELTQSRGKITIRLLDDSSWLILPCQDVSLGGHFD
ncbi:hypothetical protein BO83DRAFT_456029 [Aspergillus eucalypticola CBS 122712]|uniref:Uncharacterized protein n=1 Tax=Aspergillus eucalypticola (strain CBS 122712 / IBT 29274) TaxID=1448314 RepID=A0A317UPX7_ASPEC|nr:uncharacterized protein BO83DRAFT_456029 [Aspergillus eucalypticola CBS 122712]PWY64033.1 hypothetical protein BO83DRAFT_456029 [Aspergillus eucalypticola CBS 122712]